MIAVVCEWEGDLSVGPSGDIGVASVQAEIQQRIVRRLLTNSGDYIWHLDYGAGLGRYVGEPYSPTLIEGAVLNQLQDEALVAAYPSPAVKTSQSVAGSFSTTAVIVQYQIAGTLTEGSLVLSLGA